MCVILLSTKILDRISVILINWFIKFFNIFFYKEMRKSNIVHEIGIIVPSYCTKFVSEIQFWDRINNYGNFFKISKLF